MILYNIPVNTITQTYLYNSNNYFLMLIHFKHSGSYFITIKQINNKNVFKNYKTTSFFKSFYVKITY